jgi:hypothetical protein
MRLNVKYSARPRLLAHDEQSLRDYWAGGMLPVLVIIWSLTIKDVMKLSSHKRSGQVIPWVIYLMYSLAPDIISI